MNDSRISISIDVSQSTSPVRVMCKQGDTGRVMHISLTDGGYPYHISEDCYAVFTAVKPDGKIIRESCTIKNGIIIYTFSSQTCSCPGKMMAEIRLIGDGEKVITSASFQLTVDETIFAKEEAGGSQSEITNLEQLISDAKRIIETCDTAVRAANTAASIANSAAEEAKRAADAMAREILQLKAEIASVKNQIKQYHENGGAEEPSEPEAAVLGYAILDHAVLS